VKVAVTTDYKPLARRMVVQLSSRITTRPLNEGLASEAITSIYDVSQVVRAELLTDTNTRTVPGRPQPNLLALRMLNLTLAPFLERWHPRRKGWQAKHVDAPESAWPLDGEFRAELRALQAELRIYARSFATMIGEEDYMQMIGLEPEDE